MYLLHPYQPQGSGRWHDQKNLWHVTATFYCCSINLGAPHFIIHHLTSCIHNTCAFLGVSQLYCLPSVCMTLICTIDHHTLLFTVGTCDVHTLHCLPPGVGFAQAWPNIMETECSYCSWVLGQSGWSGEGQVLTNCSSSQSCCLLLIYQCKMQPIQLKSLTWHLWASRE